jgi:uncharacterized membrane protein (UPF0136 family)
MKKFAIPIYAFAVILIVGGVFGFVKANSIMSLVMSMFFGLVLLICGFLVNKEKLPALYVTTFSVIILHLFFLYRFFKAFKLMPAGLMVLLTTALGAPLLAYLTKRVKETVYQK